MTTPLDLIGTARYTINDTGTPYRQSDAELLGYFNDALKEISALQPAIYTVVGDLTCTAGTCEQAVSFPEAQAIVDVLCIHNGAALTPFDMTAMNAFNPNWRNDTEGAATQWSKYPNQPLRFYIYPKAPATPQVLDILYVRNPSVYSLTDPITEIPQSMYPAVIQYLVYRTEFKDDEFVLSQRAQASYQAFVAMVKGA
jgi:hypothetical protein